MNPWGMFLEFVWNDENFDMIYQGVIIKAAVLSDLNDLIFLQYEQQMNIGFLPQNIGINHVCLATFSKHGWKLYAEKYILCMFWILKTIACLVYIRAPLQNNFIFLCSLTGKNQATEQKLITVKKVLPYVCLCTDTDSLQFLCQ